MNIIIINSRNPAPKFKFCSVFSAKNPTVNDASDVPNKVTAEPLCISKSKFICKTLMST